MAGTWRVQIRELNRTIFGYNGTTSGMPQTDWPASEPDKVVFQAANRFTWQTWMLGATWIHWDTAYGNKGLAANVVGHTDDGSSNVLSLDLESDIFAAGGYTWSMIKFPSQFTKVFPSADDEITDLTKYVVGITFSTDIRRGFAEATIEIDKSTSYVSKYFQRSGGFQVVIFDNYGEKCYEGIVTSTQLDGMGGRLDCYGFSKTNDWYYGEGDSAIYPVNDPDVTAPAIVRDQILKNMYIRYDQLLAVDWGDILDAAQETDGTYNGIGPFDFEETPTKLTEVIDNVTKFGYYPADATKDWFINIWYDRIVMGNPVPKLPNDTDDVKWTLTSRNFSDDFAGVSVVTSYEDMENAKRLVYTATDGETVRTQSAYNHPFFNWFGIMEGSATSQTLSAGRAYDVLREQTTLPYNMSKPGSITVSGLAWIDGTAFSRPVHHIKAGDTIEIIPPPSANYPYPTSITSGYKFVVGKTTYNVNDMSMTIEVYGEADVIERQLLLSDFKEA